MFWIGYTHQRENWHENRGAIDCTANNVNVSLEKRVVHIYSYMSQYAAYCTNNLRIGSRSVRLCVSETGDHVRDVPTRRYIRNARARKLVAISFAYPIMSRWSATRVDGCRKNINICSLLVEYCTTTLSPSTIYLVVHRRKLVRFLRWTCSIL